MKKSIVISKRQLILTLITAVCAIIAFALFFADAVTDQGGDGLEAYKIAFRTSMGNFMFNAAALIAFVLPLVGIVLTLIPYRNTKVYLLPATVFAVSGIMIEFMFQIYQIPFSDEIRRLHTAAGEHIAPAAIIAGWFAIGAAVCCFIKAFSPRTVATVGEGDVICAPCEEQTDTNAESGCKDEQKEDNENISIDQ